MLQIEKRYEPFLFIKYRSICIHEKNVTKSILIKNREGPFSKFMIQHCDISLLYKYR